MKIYVASSWRNEKQPEIVKQLREEDFEVYDFKHSEGFHWYEIDSNWKSWTPKEFLKGLQHPLADKGFGRDMDALSWCDVCILVMPCGRSAHLELGYARGAGKATYVLLADGEPELMYKMVDFRTDNFDDIIKDLRRLKRC